MVTSVCLCIAVGYNTPLQTRSLKSSSASSVPGGPKIFGRTKKLDDQMTSRIMNKLSSFFGKHSTISSLGLAWIGKTQLSTEVFLKLSLNSAQTFKDVELVALLNATFRYQVHSRR